MFHVYVIQNTNGVLYKGWTSELEKRLAQHNATDGFSSYTSKRGPWKLVYKEVCATEEEARKREKFFKSGAGRSLLKNISGQLSAAADG